MAAELGRVAVARCAQLLQVGAHFMRDASSPDYIQVPVSRMPIDQLLCASPLWLVFALRAAEDGGRRVPAPAGQDDAVELELTLDPAAITRLTDPAVFVPTPRAVAFDARVWIDGGLLTRVSCWMRTRKRRLRPRELPLWITTELSDHGRAPPPEAPAVTPRSIDELM